MQPRCILLFWSAMVFVLLPGMLGGCGPATGGARVDRAIEELEFLGGEVERFVLERLALDNQTAVTFDKKVFLKTHTFDRKMYFVAKDQPAPADAIEGKDKFDIPYGAYPPKNAQRVAWQDTYVEALQISYRYEFDQVKSITPGYEGLFDSRRPSAEVWVTLRYKVRRVAAGRTSVPATPTGRRIWDLIITQASTHRAVMDTDPYTTQSLPMPKPYPPQDDTPTTDPLAQKAKALLRGAKYEERTKRCVCTVVYREEDRRWQFLPPDTLPLFEIEELEWSHGVPEGMHGAIFPKGWPGRAKEE